MAIGKNKAVGFENAALAGVARATRDEKCDYEGLDRLTQGLRGLDDGTFEEAVNEPRLSEYWTLDALGNWSAYDLDLYNGLFVANDVRTHNKANEIATRSIDLFALADDYDDAGNQVSKQVNPFAALDDPDEWLLPHEFFLRRPRSRALYGGRQRHSDAIHLRHLR